MEEYKFLKIREGNVIGSYELWDSISGTLYGIDKLMIFCLKRSYLHIIAYELIKIFLPYFI